MRTAFLFARQPRRKSSLLSSLRRRHRQQSHIHEAQARRSMSGGQAKAESNGHGGPESEKSHSRRPSAGRGFFVSLFACWAAAMGCLSKAAVSLEGNLDREFCDLAVTYV